MLFRINTLIIFVFICLSNSQAIFCADKRSEQAAKMEIESRLSQWTDDFNEKKAQEVCDLFAQELVASYPGTSDKNYEQMCLQLRNAISNSKKKYHYEHPVIDQIIVKDDLAIVRLIWTLKITHENNKEETIKEKGLDVLKKQKDGSWKIIISYAYPIPRSTIIY